MPKRQGPAGLRANLVRVWRISGREGRAHLLKSLRRMLSIATRLNAKVREVTRGSCNQGAA